MKIDVALKFHLFVLELRYMVGSSAIPLFFLNKSFLYLILLLKFETYEVVLIVVFHLSSRYVIVCLIVPYASLHLDAQLTDDKLNLSSLYHYLPLYFL